MFSIWIVTYHWLPEVSLKGKRINCHLIYFHIINALASQHFGLTSTRTFSDMVLCLNLASTGYGGGIGGGLLRCSCFSKNCPRKYLGNHQIWKIQWEIRRQLPRLARSPKENLVSDFYYCLRKRQRVGLFLPISPRFSQWGHPLICGPTQFPPHIMNIQKETRHRL